MATNVNLKNNVATFMCVLAIPVIVLNTLIMYCVQ